MKSAATTTMESVEASLTVRSAEMSVTYLQQEYEKAKSEYETAEVNLSVNLSYYPFIWLHIVYAISPFFCPYLHFGILDTTPSSQGLGTTSRWLFLLCDSRRFA